MSKMKPKKSVHQDFYIELFKDLSNTVLVGGLG